MCKRRCDPLRVQILGAGLDAALREPVDKLVGRIALPFGARREPEDLARLVVELVAPICQVQDRRGGHLHGRIVELDVDQLDNGREALLEVVHGCHGLVVVLKLGEQSTEPGVITRRIADLDRTFHDIEHRDRIGVA